MRTRRRTRTRNGGDFKVSRESFSTREDAESFCSAISGYSLTQYFLPAILMQNGMPIDELRSGVLYPEVLPYRRGGFRSGTIFFIKGTSKEEENAFQSKSDIVWGYTDGLDLVDMVDRLSDINGRLRAQGKQAVALPAICV